MKGSGSAGGGVIDWRRLRGTPPSAMRETLAYLDERKGGVCDYLLSGGMEREALESLKECLKEKVTK